MADKTRIAIYGGTFNPVHNGHLAVAQAVIRSGLADELWLLVTPLNPFKKGQNLLSDSIRFRMASEAVSGISGMRASDFEFSLPRPSYTYNTLKALEKEYPDKEFLLVMGADNWPKFGHWYQSDHISRNHELIIYPRNGYALPADMAGNIHVLDCPQVDISSTEIRDRIKHGLPVIGMVPDSVAAIIREEKLYL